MKDWYGILGVPATASTAEIKRAFREKAKQCHPDCTGDDSTSDFREAREAFEVLADDARRREYDRRLHSGRASDYRTSSDRNSGRRAYQRAAAEDLVDDLFDRITSMFFSEAATRDFRRSRFDHAPTAAPDLEIELTWHEAAVGVQLRIPVQRRRRCPTCHGSGGDFMFVCPTCRGIGLIIERQELHVSIPRGIADGAVLEYAIPSGTAASHRLRVLVHVS